MNVKDTSRITIRLDNVMCGWLRETAAAEHETVTDIVKEAIYLYMEERKGNDHETNRVVTNERSAAHTKYFGL